VTILAVCGLKREASILQGTRVAVGPDFAAAIDRATRGLISIGIAGGLDPKLAPGSVVLADAVAWDSDSIAADPQWCQALKSKLPAAVSGAIAGSELPIATVGAKADLHRKTGALAVDMESHLVARAAHVRGLPFAALRIVADSATTALPPAALVAMKPGGGIALDRVLKSIARNPIQIPALIRTARESEVAFAALLRCVEVLGPGLGCPYLG